MKRKFRIILFRDGSFWREPKYITARNTQVVRGVLRRDYGEAAARNSCVTAFADCPPANPRSRVDLSKVVV